MQSLPETSTWGGGVGLCSLPLVAWGPEPPCAASLQPWEAGPGSPAGFSLTSSPVPAETQDSGELSWAGVEAAKNGQRVDTGTRPGRAEGPGRRGQTLSHISSERHRDPSQAPSAQGGDSAGG